MPKTAEIIQDYKSIKVVFNQEYSQYMIIITTNNKTLFIEITREEANELRINHNFNIEAQ